MNKKIEEYLNLQVNRIAQELKEADNDKRMELLELLEPLICRFPRETFKIVDTFTSPDLEKKPKKFRAPISYMGKEHKDVLEKLLYLLNDIRYLNPEKSFDIAIKFSKFREKEEKYEKIREKAKEIIVETAKYNLNLWEYTGNFAIQRKVLQKIQSFSKEDILSNFSLVLDLCSALLNPEIEGQYSDSYTVTFRSGPIPTTEEVRKIREEVIDFLIRLIPLILSSRERCQIVTTLRGATQTPIRGNYSDELESLVLENTRMILERLTEYIGKNRDPNCLMEFEKLAAWGKQRFKDKLKKEWNEVNSKLQSDEFYTFYKFLSRERWGDLDTELSWEEQEEQRQEKIKGVVRELKETRLGELKKKLNEVAKQLPKDKYVANLFEFLFLFGKGKPKLARKFLSLIQPTDSIIKFIHFLVKGIKESTNPEIASQIIDKWLESKIAQNIRRLPLVYSGIMKNVQKKDVQTLFQLAKDYSSLNDKNQTFDRQIIDSLPWVYNKDQNTGQEILKLLLTRATSSAMTPYTEILTTAHTRKQILIDEFNSELVETLLKKLIEVNSITHDDEEILSILSKKNILIIFDFFDKRLKKKEIVPSPTKAIDRYDAIPFNLYKLSQKVSKKPKYGKLIEKVFEKWVLNSNWLYNWKGSHFIHALSPGLDSVLWRFLQDKIKTKEKRNILGVLEILKTYQGSPGIDDLCQKCIEVLGEDENVRGEVKIALLETGLVSGEDGFIRAYRKKIDRLRKWLDQKENKVVEFANEFIRELEELIEQEENKVAEERILRRKGF